MELLVIPYGAAGWERRMRLLEDIISSRPGPPFICSDVLILVPSSRMRRTYGRHVLDIVEKTHGIRALTPPDIQPIHQFLQRLYAGLGRPRLIDEITRLVMLEGIVKERIAGEGGFGFKTETLAPSLSAALSDMVERLARAGVTPEKLKAHVRDADYSDKPQVRLLTDVYSAYADALKKMGLADPAGMLSLLADAFDPSWFARRRKIIIDGIRDAGPIEAEIIRKIGACGDCLLIVEAPSPAALRSAGVFHPLRAAKDFLGSIGLPVKDDAASPGPDDLYIAGAMFSDKPFSRIAEEAPSPDMFSKNISVLSAVNAREEVSFIAGAVKKSLQSGVPADSVLVAFPSLDEYGPVVEEIFTDYGIPYNRALGRQLSASPVVTAVVSVLRVCQEDFSSPSLLRMFGSPFLKFAENPAVVPALDRFMRDRRITGVKQKLLQALKRRAADKPGKDVLTGPLNDLFNALEPFSTKAPASLLIWMGRLEGIISWSGLGARVSLIKGPLSANLQAYRKLMETVSSMTRAGGIFPRFTYTFDEWLFMLRKTLMHTRFQVPPEDEGGVQILGLEESAAHPWSEIYLGGLMDGRLPLRLPQNIFMPEAALEALGVHTLEKARLSAALHFYRLLLSAPKVVLSWPENDGDRPAAPSPFLKELTPLITAGLVNRGLKNTAGVQFSLRIEDSMSAPELAKAVGLAGDIKGLDKLLTSGIEGAAGIVSALNYRPAQAAPALAPAPKRSFQVTELDLYLQCPYDYYVTRVLGIAPLEEVTEDVSPIERGSKVHDILLGFYRAWNKPVTRENRGEALRLLRSLAESAFMYEADTIRNRREKETFVRVMAERFLDSEEEYWKQGMRPVYLEQEIGSFRLPLPDGTDAEIRGKIDRIDADNDGNFIIVDYKTGKYPQPRMDLEQDIFQLPVYAVMAREALSNRAPALKRPVGLAYYDLKGRIGPKARDVVLYDEDSAKDQPSTKPRASSKKSEVFERILTMSMEKAVKAVKGIIAGDFAPGPEDENRCRYCPNEIMCEKRNEE